mmetsp:Transcript_95612/g.309723  ORF Transcript_95612/g.309723 Transcript_95612/m.309723 type:complete len:159 (+) Transcript_95612:3-479(+)
MTVVAVAGAAAAVAAAVGAAVPVVVAATATTTGVTAPEATTAGAATATTTAVVAARVVTTAAAVATATTTAVVVAVGATDGTTAEVTGTRRRPRKAVPARILLAGEGRVFVPQVLRVGHGIEVHRPFEPLWSADLCQQPSKALVEWWQGRHQQQQQHG